MSPPNPAFSTYVPRLTLHSQSLTSSVCARRPLISGRSFPSCCSTSPISSSPSSPPPSSTPDEPAAIEPRNDELEKRSIFQPLITLYNRMRESRTKLKAGVIANYGLAAFLAYGMFDAITYSTCFLLALRAFLAAGKTLTWQTLPQVLAVMWGLNNLTRPFRIVGTVALAPVVDRIIVKPCRAFIVRLRKQDRQEE